MVMNQTPTTKLVFSARTTCGRPTTRMLESSVAMKMPTVVTVRTTHLYSKDKPPDCQAFPSLRLTRYKTPPRDEISMLRVRTVQKTRSYPLGSEGIIRRMERRSFSLGVVFDLSKFSLARFAPS